MNEFHDMNIDLNQGDILVLKDIANAAAAHPTIDCIDKIGIQKQIHEKCLKVSYFHDFRNNF